MTTGILLGDANLQKPSGCRYYRLRFAQNSVRQDYVIHLFKKKPRIARLFLLKIED